jgi:IMP cyclohydrolase
MSGKTVTAEPSAIAIGWSMQCQIDDRRVLTAQTHVPADSDAHAIRDALTKVFDAMDFVQARYRLPILEKEIASETHFRDEALKQADLIEKRGREQHAVSGRKAEYRLSAQDQAQKNNFETTVKRHEMILADKAEEAATIRKMLNGSAGAQGA